jgi:hypothetical protein
VASTPNSPIPKRVRARGNIVATILDFNKSYFRTQSPNNYLCLTIIGTTGKKHKQFDRYELCKIYESLRHKTNLQASWQALRHMSGQVATLELITRNSYNSPKKRVRRFFMCAGATLRY